MARFVALDRDQELPTSGLRFDIHPLPDAAIDVVADDGRPVAIPIFTAFTIDDAKGRHAVNEDPVTFARALAISGAPIIGGVATMDGRLDLILPDGVRVSVPGGRHENWRVEIDGTTWLPQPGTGLAAWLPDLTFDASESADDVVNAYLRDYRSSEESDGSAWDEVDGDVSYGGHEQLWSRLLELIRLARDEMELHYIAAGPLEDLLNQGGKAFIDRVEQEAGRDPKFKRAVAGVWLAKKRGQIWDRVQALLYGDERDAASTVR